MDEKLSLHFVIVAFLLIVLGAAFVGILSDVNWSHRNTNIIVNETLTAVSNATSSQLAYYPISSITSLSNASADSLGEIVLATNYSTTTGSIYYLYNGQLQVNRNAWDFEGEDLNITYVYNPSGFVRQSNARVLLNLIPLFFVIALLMFVVVPVLKKFDIF